MGAESRIDRIMGSNPRDAFLDACDAARLEHGARGYTGSIAEAHGYRLANERAPYAARLAAERGLETGAIDGIPVTKWGAAVLVGIKPAQETRTLTVGVDVTGLNRDAMRRACEAAITSNLGKDEVILDLEIVADSRWSFGGDALATARALAKRVVKAAVKRTEGDQATYWQVIVGSPSQHNIFGTYEKLSDAKERARHVAAGHGSEEVGIIKIVTRSNNRPLFTASAEVVKESVGVCATLGKLTGGPITEWYAAGVYSC